MVDEVAMIVKVGDGLVLEELSGRTVVVVIIVDRGIPQCRQSASTDTKRAGSR